MSASQHLFESDTPHSNNHSPSHVELAANPAAMFNAPLAPQRNVIINMVTLTSADMNLAIETIDMVIQSQGPRAEGLILLLCLIIASAVGMGVARDNTNSEIFIAGAIGLPLSFLCCCACICAIPPKEDRNNKLASECVRYLIPQDKYAIMHPAQVLEINLSQITMGQLQLRYSHYRDQLRVSEANAMNSRPEGKLPEPA